ncbi:endonuclease/exonuclease/phosphatase family protein [Rhodococcus sp. BP-349]|uniref:endonuclease/exonuclease/phosphatase family protein n=1 Tax=unclassified Rhodococcus (in: high G+C Gram-positive bacteria) TaxID=192944 RepID=UPI001C9AE95E|nr:MULTISPECIES: endonuclease/exonuclease/phosphatase family protein [unclassified Rhodococcus (in: high G+C Gram-positive bacteria)]MBY6538756.1 endonuclease/exonuclease/phosphatase family protein [Rhodococcus sp. BP-363]MBY6543093.1 endonuclease/exonuclease/phosphatase family protein [Rhodococcus sp. BP-369]MBY6562323.1 endonuclease/exonuclease/phosphatase family protein [Rhodococcus sp. BP-370]MBY6576615.1 endonuclease/exonuclease/phosphatase family protein [Rhodococcus sp. BP-364]MBY658591
MRARAIAAVVIGLGGVAAGLVAVVSSMLETRSMVVVGPASAAPLLLCVTVVGVVVCLLARRWWIAAASAVLLGLGAVVAVPLYVPGAAGVADAAPGEPLRVMQANVKLGEADPQALVSSVRERRIDVLTVQELTEQSVGAFDAAGLSAALPYRFVAPYQGGAGAAIYSRFPLSNGRELPGYLLASVTADLDVGAAQPLRVYAVHPVPPWPTPTPVWASELDMLGDELAQASPGAVIVGGDFNSTHAHKRFRDLLTGGYVDAADAVGAGLIPTYPMDAWYPPVVGIDHVVVRDAQVRSLEAVDIVGSDHRGLVATVDVP